MESLLKLEQKYKNQELCGNDFSEEEFLHVRITKDGLIVHSRTDDCTSLLGDLLEELIKPEVAENLYILNLDGTDTGANGTHGWYLEGLADGYFPKLVQFHIHQCEGYFHNCHILSSDDYYEEGNVTAKILVKMPNLLFFKTPSAPGSEIFTFDNKIREMHVDIGYDNQNFLFNLADSTNFKNLRFLQYGQINVGVDDVCIKFEELLYFVKSDVCRKLGELKLKNIKLTKKEIKQLNDIATKDVKKYCSLSIIDSRSNWV